MPVVRQAVIASSFGPRFQGKGYFLTDARTHRGTSGAGVSILCFAGLAHSFWPCVVPDRLTMWEAASAPESLLIIFIGAAAVPPVIVGYTLYVYRVSGGKARDLSYD